MLLALDSTTKSIVAFGGNANASNISFVAVYADSSGTAFTEGVNDGVLQGSTYVTVVAAPSAGVRRIIKSITFYNNFSGPNALLLELDNNGTKRRIVYLLLGAQQTWSSDDLGSAGTFKLVNDSTPIEGGTNGSVLYNVNGIVSEIARTGTSTLVSSVSPTIATPTIITPSVQQSITSTTSGFDLINTTATTVNFAGAAQTLNIGGAASAITSLSAGSGSVVNLGGGANAAELRFLEPSGSGTNYTALKAQAQAANVTYTLPAADGSNGEVLATNGSGVLSWAAGGSGGSGLGYKNLLINGGMSLDRRGNGASRTVADDVYSFDRWYVLTQNAAGCAVAQQTFQSNGRPHNVLLTQNQATAGRIGFAQIIEGKNCTHLRGQQVTLSFDYRYSLADPVRYAILEWTGTEDSVTSDVVSNWTSTNFTTGNFFISTTTTLSGTTNMTPSANTWTAATPLTVTLGSSFTNLIVFIWTENAPAQNNTLQLTNVQLEPGASKTDFDRRGFPLELSLAQRYLYVFRQTSSYNEFLCAAAINGATSGFMFFPNPVEPRKAIGTGATAPYYIFSENATGLTVSTATGDYNFTGIDQFINNGLNISLASIAVQFSTAGGMSFGSGYVYARANQNVLLRAEIEL